MFPLRSEAICTPIWGVTRTVGEGCRGVLSAERRTVGRQLQLQKVILRETRALRQVELV